jgi:S1-C subfamily serine protease/tetratricopeptide (TPR) repeat protein
VGGYGVNRLLPLLHPPQSASASAPGVAPSDARVERALQSVRTEKEAAKDAGPAATTQPITPANAQTLYTRVSPAVVRIQVRDASYRLIGTGSGFFVSGEGLLVTNHHVIADAKFLDVDTSNETMVPVDGIVVDNKNQDVALLKVKMEGLPFLELGDVERPPIGTKVYAVGHPLGQKGAILSEGLISGVGEPALGGGVRPIHTTAPISSGSSGGPLVTEDGKVVGITTAALTSGQVNQNFNVAMPVSIVHDMLKKSGGATPTVTPLNTAGAPPIDRETAQALQPIAQAMEMGDRSRALDLLAELKPKFKDNATYWMTCADVHTTMSNYQAAADDYANAIRVKPDFVKAHGYRGAMLEKLGKHREAIKSYEAAAKLDPKDPKSYASAALCYMGLGQPDKAVPFLKWAIKLRPADFEYQRRLAMAYSAMEQDADAAMCLQQAVKLRPNDAVLLVSLAECYIKLRRTDEALDPLKKAVALQPGNARAHVHLGLIALERNDVGEALLELQTAARLDHGSMGQAAASLVQLIQARQQQQAMAQQQALQQQLLPQQPRQGGQSRRR